MEDTEVVSRCLNGEKEAFEVLVRKYQAPLLALSANILHDLEEARDVTQESFTKAFVNLGNFDHDRSFKSWLYSITVHECIDRKRRAGSFFRKMDGLGREAGPRPLPGPEGTGSTDHGLNRLLQALSARERTAVSLSFVEGYNAREIGQVMNCSEKTVRVHIFRSKSKLRRLLKENRYA